MTRRFKSKKRKQRQKTVTFLIIAIFAFALSLSFFSSLFQKKEVLDFFLNTSLFPNQKKMENNTFIDFLLDYTIGRQERISDEIYDGSKSIQEYTPDPAPEENKSFPIIYLYNTHQGEEYYQEKTFDYQVTPTVMLAAYKLREELNKKGLNTIVETNPISEVLKINNWNYASSYKASRLLMEDAKEKNPTLKYYIDLHRDAISYENSILTVENKTYAKILFVIGTDHDHYEENLKFATMLDEKLNAKVKGISRGIIKKGGKGVNGIYNQDFSSETLLFEIGGEYNKMNEVSNTLCILAEVLKEWIG